ncbi:hypothetical protein L0C72_001334 [Salmonella enterica]|nr:hypothetical protein [Salmonella enterica]EIS6639639.1 hypothetical protein [Salmonella enterica]EIS6737402.1 hypothetical protein [Salmonella enterica]
MPIREFSDEEYQGRFITESRINNNALQQALDIRKYEIDHYWKRATYFWTFIAATLAGFVAIQTSSSTAKTDLSVLLCSLGIVFSFGWLCVNRGSKYWQENWEKHVDMLEDNINGPLYKVVLSRARPKGIKEVSVHLLTGPSPISVSKINQIISLFITIVWIGLLMYSLPPFDLKAPLNFYYIFLILMTVITCTGFITIARTYSGGYWHSATIRTSSINNQARE